MAAETFEPMSVGQIFDRAFRMYRNHFARFLAVIAVIYIPLGLVQILLNLAFASSAQQGSEQDPAVGAGMAVAGGLLALIQAVAILLANGALIRSVSGAYRGENVSAGQAYGFVMPRLLSLIGASLLVGLIIGVGLMLCIVPGIIFWLWFILTTQCIVVERIGAIAGMKRSRELARGNMLKVFLVWLVVTVISLLVGFGIAFVAGAVTGAAGMEGTGQIVINGIVELALRVLLAPVFAAAFILLYYDIRIRKEGFDLEMLAQRMGTGPQAGEQPPSLPPSQV